MKLRELLLRIIDVNSNVEIKGVTCNPKRVKEDYHFVCMSSDRLFGVIPARDAGI
ncbi:hypothetical protein HET73_03540 [Wolbachia endosymbiont of Atemnus politus]|nr:hypothetical protein [Wolbachia endosymbiont of Atemnus politus]NSX83809.1 hypothetical protein [Wolbachia endosymbiont of Atemnus politus]